jgi:hypothetical protein
VADLDVADLDVVDLDVVDLGMVGLRAGIALRRQGVVHGSCEAEFRVLSLN